MRNRIAALCLAVVVLVASAAAQIPLLAPSALPKLEDLKGKVLMIRGFYGGPKLHFDANGSLLEGGRPESWTLAGFEVTEVKRRGDRLEIQGTRVALLYDQAAKSFRNVRRQVIVPVRAPKPDKLTITVDTSGSSDAAAIAAVQRVFLRIDDHLADMVPECWRAFIAKDVQRTEQPAAGDDKPAVQAGNQPAGQQPASPGNVEGKPPTLNEVGTPVPADLPARLYRVGGDVTPPRPISDPEPDYDEPARAARIQGTTVLSIIVGSDGSVRDVRITRPIGFGLDDNAVAAVSKWRFEPATKGGQPVPVQVRMEVNFRLY